MYKRHIWPSLTEDVEGDFGVDGPADFVVGDADVDALVLAADVRQIERGAGRRQPPTREVLVVLQRGRRRTKKRMRRGQLTLQLQWNNARARMVKSSESQPQNNGNG